MDISINLDFLNQFLNFVIYAPPIVVYWYLFTHGAWFLLVTVFYKLFLDFFMLNRITSHIIAKYKWTYLAIDVPKGNEQTPKAVEYIFSHLAGAHKDPDLEEGVLGGFLQPWFSLEIISIEGYIQFIVVTQKKYRDLVEAAIYAQYPDAEITEIEDYAKNFPRHFPNDTYELFGCEYTMTNPEQSYPIRTYTEFEHSGAEVVYKDPLSALLETFSRIGKGEFIGFQILIKPISGKWRNWKKHGQEVVTKMTGAKTKHKDSWVSKLGLVPGMIFDGLAHAIVGGEAAAPEKTKDEAPSLMLHLPPGFKTDIEKVENKISKICFATKIRSIYIAKHEVYNKNRYAYGTTGAMKQFITENLNGLKPDFDKTGTHSHYYLKETRDNWRRTKLANAYIDRSRWKGGDEMLMNIEELASIWHFPMLSVMAPMVSKTAGKKAEPPSSLPTDRGSGVFKEVTKKQATPPPNLPM